MNGTIQFIYIGDFFPISEIDNIKYKLSEQDINFTYHDTSNELQMCLEDLITPIILKIDPDFIKNFLLGITSAITYEILKYSIINIWKYINNQKIKKITPKEIKQSELRFDLHFNITETSNIKFRLDSNIPQDKRNICIDRAFELIETNTFPIISEGHICIYDLENNEWILYKDSEYIKKIYYSNSSKLNSFTKE